MITPAKTCQGKPFCDQWAKIVDGTTFTTAVEQAMLEMVLQQGRAPDMGNAAANGWKVEGAKQYLAILMALGTKPVTPEKKPAQAVNYGV